MKPIIKNVLCVSLLAVTGAASASDYIYTVEGGLSWWDFEGDNAWGTDVTAYFEPVSTSGVPLAEAGFLSHASNLSINYARETGGDFDLTEGALEVYANDFFAAVSASRWSNDYDVESYGLRTGWMVTPSTRLTGGWDRIESDDEPDIDVFTIGAKHVALFQGGRAINLEGNVGSAHNGSTKFAYDLQADYYPIPELGFGARYAGIGSDDQYGLGTRYFFLPRWSGEVEWLRDREDNDDIFQLRLGARF